jgi:hypothetical protein
MNKRILELAEQAGFIGEGFQDTVMGTCQETALENFAELIVKECIKATGNCAGTGDMIKEHFGVE